MSKKSIATEALIEQFTQASANQGQALRQSVEQATLKALQGRELTMKSIKDVLKTMTQAASAGAANSGLAGTDLESLLAKSVEGMDAALVQAVEANRRALQQLVDLGAQLRETQLKKAMVDIEKMEDVLFATITKAVSGTAAPVQGPWASALDAFKKQGSATGPSAVAAVEQLTTRAREATREGRALGQRSALAWMDHYATLASGVLIGMTTGLGSKPAAAAAAPPAKKAARKKAAAA